MNRSTHAAIATLVLTLAMTLGLGCASEIPPGERVDVSSRPVLDLGVQLYAVHVDPAIGLTEVSLLSPEETEIGSLTTERSEAMRAVTIMFPGRLIEVYERANRTSFWLNGEHLVDVPPVEVAGGVLPDDPKLASIADELELAAAVMEDPSLVDFLDRQDPARSEVQAEQPLPDPS